MTFEPGLIDARFIRILLWLHWAVLLLAIAVSAVQVESNAKVLGAALGAGAYVVALQAIRIASGERWHLELLSVGGAAAALTAIALTDGAESPYLLFSLAPTMLGSGLLGRRVGIQLAVISAGGLMIVASLLEQDLGTGSLLLTAALHLLVAAVLPLGRRALVEARASAESARIASEDAAARTDRLQSAHDLLLRLSSVADTTELNPVNVGRETLERLGEAVDFDAALVAINGVDGPVVVARKGEEAVQHHRTTFPLLVNDREVGFVVISRTADFSDEDRAVVDQATIPLALAFSNILLLGDIAKRAVKEERVRLARELHDEIGPSLASVGLALDLALLQYPTEPDLGTHLQDLRGSVTKLVDEIRTAVTDLREEAGGSLLQTARALRAGLSDGSTAIKIDIEERRPPRPAVAGELSAIFTEAIRNAVHHADATVITIAGYVDYHRGEVVITDDGTGFDPDTVKGGHFGLLGMAERAEAIGATILVESSPGAGTVVSISWGNR